MRFIRLLASVLALVLLAAAPRPALAQDEPETIRVGLFVTNLFDVDFAREDVEAQFWVWFNHTDPNFDPKRDIEIVNGREVEVLSSTRTDAGDKGYWDQVKYSAVLDASWNVVNYPFDRQTIRIVIESTSADARSLKLEPDLDGSKLRRGLSMAGWQIEDMKISAAQEFYETAYGDPTMNPVGPSIYPRITAEIDIKRDGWRLLLSTFIGFGLAIALAGIVLTASAFRHSAEVIDIGAQLAIATGALFSTVGTGYIMQSGLPPTTVFSLADAFQITAFTVTFLTMLMIYVVHVLRKRRMWKAALTTGRVMFALYLLAVLWIIYRVGVAVLA